MMENSFVALDFETANYKRTSICSVGMVKVVANEIVETFYTLVNPNDFLQHVILKFTVFKQNTYNIRQILRTCIPT